MGKSKKSAIADFIDDECSVESVSHASRKKERKLYKYARAKGWFLTYARCDLEKEDLLNFFLDKFSANPFKYIIAREHHKDGGLHLHAFLKFDSIVNNNGKAFDFAGKHPNCKIAKNYKQIYKYITKEDDFISNFDVRAALQKKNSSLEKEDLLADVDDLLDAGKIKPMSVYNWYKNSCVYKMLTKKKRKPIKFFKKQRHLWFYGASNTGKTTLLKTMINHLGRAAMFQIPYNNDWVGYDNQRFLYADEFKGQLSVQQLNAICDGGLKVNIKGSSAELVDDTQVIICSNFCIRDCFLNAGETVLETLMSRFSEINCSETRISFEAVKPKLLSNFDETGAFNGENGVA